MAIEKYLQLSISELLQFKAQELHLILEYTVNQIIGDAKNAVIRYQLLKISMVKKLKILLLLEKNVQKNVVEH